MPTIGELFEVYTLVFARPPEALDKHIVHPTPFAIHGDFDVVLLQNPGKFKACELTSLVGNEMFGRRFLQHG